MSDTVRNIVHLISVICNFLMFFLVMPFHCIITVSWAATGAASGMWKAHSDDCYSGFWGLLAQPVVTLEC